MKSLWPESFSEIPGDTPENMVEEQMKYLPKLTGDKVYGELIKGYELFFDFSYDVRIKGKFLDNYSFSLFKIKHNILIYPVSFDLEGIIKEELYPDVTGDVIAENYNECEEILDKILKSERVKLIIGTIMTLSK